MSVAPVKPVKYLMNNAVDNTYEFNADTELRPYNQVTFRLDGITAAICTIEVQPPGSTDWFEVPNGAAIDLSVSQLISFTNSVQKIRFILSTVIGSGSILATNAASHMGG